MIEVVLDTETTGLSVKDGHRIVEIGCIELENLIPTKKFFHKYLNPERKVSESAYKVHGYDDNFLSDKEKFREIASPFLLESIFPRTILNPLKIYFKNPKSSTDLDKKLSISLSKFDNIKEHFFLEELEMGQLFLHGKGNIFKKISKKRKRFVCEKISNRKLYLFQPNSLILNCKYEKRQ